MKKQILFISLVILSFTATRCSSPTKSSDDKQTKSLIGLWVNVRFDEIIKLDGIVTYDSTYLYNPNEDNYLLAWIIEFTKSNKVQIQYDYYNIENSSNYNIDKYFYQTISDSLFEVEDGTDEKFLWGLYSFFKDTLIIKSEVLEGNECFFKEFHFIPYSGNIPPESWISPSNDISQNSLYQKRIFNNKIYLTRAHDKKLNRNFADVQ